MGETSDGHRRGEGACQCAACRPIPAAPPKPEAQQEYSSHVRLQPATRSEPTGKSRRQARLMSFRQFDHARFCGSRRAEGGGLLLPGTELVFDRDVECDHALGFFPNKKVRENVARFRQINLDNPYEHHDALEFPGGTVVLLTRLCAGQRATVIQLPQVSSRPKARTRARFS